MKSLLHPCQGSQRMYPVLTESRHKVASGTSYQVICGSVNVGGIPLDLTLEFGWDTGFMMMALLSWSDYKILRVEARLILPPEEMEASIHWFNRRGWFDAVGFQNTSWKMLVSHSTNDTAIP